VALWLDEDDGHFPDNGPQPTFIVHSSANRRHLYWRIAEPIPTAKAVELNRRIAIWSGGDAGKAGCASVLRVPGTFNFKRQSDVDHVVGEETGVEPWSLEILAHAIPPLPEKPKPKPRPKSGGKRHVPDVPLAEWLDQAGVEVLEQAPDDTAVIKFAVVCPWVDVHTGGDRTGTYVGEYADGQRFFGCHHQHCEGRFYRDFYRAVQPQEYVRFGPRSRRARVFTSRVVRT